MTPVGIELTSLPQTPYLVKGKKGGKRKGREGTREKRLPPLKFKSGYALGYV